MENFNIDPQYIEYILEYLLPALVALFVTVFGARKVLEEVRAMGGSTWDIMTIPTTVEKVVADFKPTSRRYSNRTRIDLRESTR